LVMERYEKDCPFTPLPDDVDNCPFAFNPRQLDSDLDGVDDVCDLD